MRKILFVLMAAGAVHTHAQDLQKKADEMVHLQGGGSMGKKTIVPKVEKLALAQTSVLFKTASTREFMKNERGGLSGGRKALGGSVAGRLTAYLDISDGELTQSDYQQLSDHFDKQINNKLNAAGIPTVDWNTISGAGYHQSFEDDKDEDNKEALKKGQIYQVVNAHGGKSLVEYNPYKTMNFGIAFGKIKKLSGISEDVGAPIVFTHLVVDFADILLDGDVHTGEDKKYGGGMVRITKTKKWDFDASAGANVKLLGGLSGGRLMFYNSKSQSDYMTFTNDVSSDMPFADEVSKDENRKALNKKENIFAKDFTAVPVVISTTKAKYMAAVKKAMDNAAELLVEKIKLSRKA